MGLIEDQEGIMRRYLAEKGGQNNHLANSKNFIIESLKDSGAKKVAILGSGWLLDVSVSFLAEKIETVYFIDIRHPKAITYKYRKQENFKFIEMDLSGDLLSQVYTILNQKVIPTSSELLKMLEFKPLKLPFSVDFTVSLNLLSQLDTLIIDYIEKVLGKPLENVQEIRQAIQKQHLDMLSPDCSCLITDIEEINLTSDLTTIESKPLIFAKLPDGTLQEEWVWKFDTKMTYHSGCITYFKVKAVKI